MKLADKISLKLQKYVRECGQGIVLPNFFVRSYEMDVFRLLNTGMLYEYEIKISRSDFKNDFKKGSKHSLMARKESPCNRFYFVTPVGLVHQNEIPEYAGLIEYHLNDDGDPSYMMLVKNAKLIHKNKVSDSFWRDVAYKVSFREVNWRQKLKIAYEEINNLREIRINKSYPPY